MFDDEVCLLTLLIVDRMARYHSTAKFHTYPFLSITANKSGELSEILTVLESLGCLSHQNLGPMSLPTVHLENLAV